VEAPGDAELISAVRGGDTDAYGLLFERHVEAARRLARQLVSAGDVEDLVSEAFVKVLQVLQRGGGPDVAFRAYLLTAVRRLRVDRLRATSRLHTTDDMEMFDPGVPFRDTAVEGFESATAARAFASLPERWQLVLWHTEVEGQKPADVAPLLGMSANSVSALAYRAREGLRQAYLNEHASELDDESCQWTRAHLGAYIRNGISRRDAGKVEDHLGHCRTCAAIYLELSEVNSNLGAILAPLLLGGVGVAYASAATGVAAPVGLLGVLDRTRDLVAAHSQAAAVLGVTTAVAIGGGGFLVWQETRPPAVVSGELAGTGSPGDATAPAGRTSPSSGGSSGDPSGGSSGDTSGTEQRGDNSSDNDDPATAPADDATVPVTVDTPGPTAGTTTGPTSDPTSDATSDATSDPTSDQTTGTSAPTSGPTSGPTRDPEVGSGTTQDTEPTGTPTGGPTPGPTPGPTDAPTPTLPPPPPAVDPTPTPTPTPDPLPPRNLALSVAVEPINGVVADLVATVSGIPPGETATVVVRGALITLTSDDPRCTDGAVMTCTVQDSRPFEVRAVAGNINPPTVTFTVTGAGGPDDDPADDSVTVTWE
jgi:RNA polymerase sigma factor (sigma-70 family)